VKLDRLMMLNTTGTSVILFNRLLLTKNCTEEIRKILLNIFDDTFAAVYLVIDPLITLQRYTLI